MLGSSGGKGVLPFAMQDCSGQQVLNSIPVSSPH